MKALFVATLILLPIFANAQTFGRTIYNCTYWTHKDGAYVCGGYPQREQLVETHELNMTIRQLESRIAALEKQLAEKNK